MKPIPRRTLQELAQLLASKARKDVLSGLAGEIASHFQGNGLDFKELREYHLEDDARHVHWPSAMSPGPVAIKQFHDEYELTDFIALDVSASMTTNLSKWNLATETTALLCAISMLCGDGASLLRFSDHTESFDRLPAGYRSLQTAARLLLTIPEHSSRTAISPMCASIRNALRKPSRVFIITDLIDDGYDAALRNLAFHHDVTVCHVLPDITTELPMNATEVEDAETGERISITPNYLSQAIASRQDFLDSVRKSIRATGAAYIHFSTAHSPMETFKNAIKTI